MLRILLAGDSTVTEQARDNDDPGLNYCGWGQMIGRFFDDTQIFNYAVSGYTTHDFREKGQYDKLKDELRTGDYVLVQFGHNDQKRPELRADEGYFEALDLYIKEIRAFGGSPVFVTPVARNTWHEGGVEYWDLLADYANAMKNVARKNDIPLIDLHGASVEWIISLGQKGAKRYFYPGDFTHPNEYGGFKWAELIAGLVKNSEHAGFSGLREKLKPTETWEALDIEESNADPETGWLFPPNEETDYKEALKDVIAFATQRK